MSEMHTQHGRDLCSGNANFVEKCQNVSNCLVQAGNANFVEKCQNVYNCLLQTARGASESRAQKGPSGNSKSEISSRRESRKCELPRRRGTWNSIRKPPIRIRKYANPQIRGSANTQKTRVLEPLSPGLKTCYLINKLEGVGAWS